jgi:hypothetical protein
MIVGYLRIIGGGELELDFLQVRASGDFDWWVIVPGQPG